MCDTSALLDVPQTLDSANPDGWQSELVPAVWLSPTHTEVPGPSSRWRGRRSVTHLTGRGMREASAGHRDLARFSWRPASDWAPRPAIRVRHHHRDGMVSRSRGLPVAVRRRAGLRLGRHDRRAAPAAARQGRDRDARRLSCRALRRGPLIPTSFPGFPRRLAGFPALSDKERSRFQIEGPRCCACCPMASPILAPSRVCVLAVLPAAGSVSAWRR